MAQLSWAQILRPTQDDKAKGPNQQMKQYYVYIMTNQSGTLYTGVTNDLTRRIYEHRQGEAGHFTTRYRITRLLYFEETRDIHAALDREKQLKGWTRAKKLELINTNNPKWVDLSADWDMS
ncbi:MAG: GIY-YIG nuclease family protein [Nitrospirales bacterium]|nr:GIY-YIG nuclease family protein [Nitrospirales bacterium]